MATNRNDFRSHPREATTLPAAKLCREPITFAIYPITLFDPASRLILFTLTPAALMGAVPASFARSFGWGTLGQLAVGALVFLGLSVLLFYTGLRRYESGSAVQVEV